MTLSCKYVCGLALLSLSLRAAEIGGRVVDPQGAAVARAVVELKTSLGNVNNNVRSDDQGSFRLVPVRRGAYELVATAPGFAAWRGAVTVAGDSDAIELQVVLDLDPVVSSVTITTTPGIVEDPLETPQPTTVTLAAEASGRRGTVLPQLLRDQTGLHIQQTSAHQGAVFVRGLTGQQVVTLIDGVRFNNATFRSGPNQYQALIDPALLERAEVTRGPSAVQYGSDAMGGAVNLLTHRQPLSENGLVAGGAISLGMGTADWSGAGDLRAHLSGPRVGFTVGGFGHRINDLRAGRGDDSHAAIGRFLGLSSAMLGNRLQDTGFDAFGGSARLTLRPAPNQHLAVYYSRSQQQGGRRYDQLNGGNGNLVHGFDPQSLDFAYARYEKQGLGRLDSLAATISLNRIRDDHQTQSGDPLAPITFDFARTGSIGGQLQAAARAGTRQILGFGGEVFDETVRSRLYRLDPVTGIAGSPQRPRFPDGAAYRTYATWFQDRLTLLGDRWRLIGGLRYSAFRYAAPGGDGVSLATGDLTWHAGSSYFLAPGLSLNAIVSRGFRAPNISDLSQIGLTSNGFEVAASEAARAGAAVIPLRPESLLNYEAGLKLRAGAVATEVSWFLSDIRNLITKRELILPPGAAGRTIGGERIVSQDSFGRILVPVDLRPVITRVNAAAVRIAGIELSQYARLGSDWTIEANCFWLRGRDQRPPAGGSDVPNLEGGLPPATGHVRLRYHPGSRWWLEAASNLAWHQDRLSALDLNDQRIGATRTRASIANYFSNGARARGLTADGILLATGETLAQVQDRVLGTGVASAPWYAATLGYAIFHLRAGLQITERSTLRLLVENLLDKNYRAHGSGIDGAGHHVQLRYTLRW